MASSSPPERYTLGYTSTASVSYHASRTAAGDASFFLPYLKPGVSLLDCGCGPGSITIGLAGVVAPGRVVGVDIGAEYVQRARSAVLQEGVGNVSFQEGSIYELPFASDSFDAAIAHAVLTHLGDPIKALAEMHRVLVPGGVVGVRVTCHSGDLWEPPNPLVARTHDLIARLHRQNGSDNLVGKRLRPLLRAAGFVGVRESASYECFGDPDRAQTWAERVAGGLTQPPVSEQLIDLGWASSEDLEDIALFWRSWAQDPDAFYARSWREVVGWKE